MTKCGIYTITNIESGRVYVGSSTNLDRRFRDHRSALRNGRHCNVILQRAWEKYEESAFQFSVVELIPDATQLLAREQHWMEELESSRLYNIAPNAGNSLGRTLGEETRKKISQAKLGRKATPEDRARMSEQRKGRCHSPEAREKIAAAKRGRTLSEETKRKMSMSRIGNRNSAGCRLSDERKKQISEFFKGHQHNRGRIHSEQARRNMADAQVRRQRQAADAGPAMESV